MWDIGHLNGMKIKTWNLEVTMCVQETDSILTFMLCLEVLRERRLEGRRAVEKSIEGNDYPPPYLDVFKIK